jgi:hypothetical protein
VGCCVGERCGISFDMLGTLCVMCFFRGMLVWLEGLKCGGEWVSKYVCVCVWRS